MTVAVLVPLETGCEYRLRAWSYVRNHYKTHHPDWQLVVGTAPDMLWSKGYAVHDAFTRTDADRLVIADADSLVEPAHLHTAVALLERHPWVMPWMDVHRLTREATEAVYAGVPLSVSLSTEQHTSTNQAVGTHAGGIVALTRDAYATVGGIDPRFRGWGGEDLAFGWALETLVAPPHRLRGSLYHLWHPWKNRQKFPQGSRHLRNQYREAFLDPEAMTEVIDGCRLSPRSRGHR